VLIAVPDCQGRVSPVLDVAARLVLVRLRGGAEVERKEIVLFERQPEGMVQSLRECGVRVVICGGISQGLLTALQHAGIRVVSHVCGGLDLVVTAFRSGDLAQPEFAMPGCCGRCCGFGHRRRRRRKGSGAVQARALAHLQMS
jgi:predicted Fe-Mo cluster-binding NifX family protein